LGKRLRVIVSIGKKMESQDALKRLQAVERILEDNPCVHQTEDGVDPDCVLCEIRQTVK